MIRSIRLRLLARPANLHTCPRHRHLNTSTSYALSPEPEADEAAPVREPYGNAYGAGPSRIPYQAPEIPQSGLVERSGAETRALHQVHQLLGGKEETITASDVEKLLGPGSDHIFDSLGRLGTTSLVHHLLDIGEPLLAARLLLRSIDSIPVDRSHQGLSSIRKATLLRVFSRATLPPGHDKPKPGHTLRLIRRGTEDIDILLPLLAALQRVRNERHDRIYRYMLERLCAEGLYDTAAKVYVGLVEEWATEGRIAEGADPESFYDGGGPPREGRSTWESESPIYQTWWKGIRTWALPGEVLSPHDRLDLWHPRKLKLPERLRKFPMPVPTSPPSLVPHPTMQNLTIICDHLELDPEIATHEAFERSMRACAILASTILSRTLPYVSARLLQNILGNTPTTPAVFPENVKVPPGKDAWAYTANTHIHLAIRSILLSPPTIPSLFQYMIAYDKAKTDETPVPELPAEYRYRTAPLNFASCLFLTQYGIRKLRSATSIVNIARYTRQAYGRGAVEKLAHYSFRALSWLRQNGVAASIERVLFSGTLISPTAPPLSEVRSPRRSSRIRVEQEDRWHIKDSDGGDIQLNHESLNAALQHMTATKQYDRFVDTVYRLVPYLQHSKASDPVPAEMELRPEGTGRPIPNILTPMLYSTLIEGLAQMRAVDLGHRMYLLALHSERYWRRGRASGDRLPDKHRLEIRTFTAMIHLQDDVIRLERRKYEQSKSEIGDVADERKLASRSAKMPRYLAVELGIWRTYIAAQRRWKNATWDESTGTYDNKLAGSIAPDERFFNAFILARAAYWGLRDGSDWSTGLLSPAAGHDWPARDRPRMITEMRMVIRDMAHWGHQPPLGLMIRCGMANPFSLERLDSLQKEHGLRHLASLSILPQSRPVVPDVLIRSPSIDVELASFPIAWGSSEEERPRHGIQVQL